VTHVKNLRQPTPPENAIRDLPSKPTTLDHQTRPDPKDIKKPHTTTTTTTTKLNTHFGTVSGKEKIKRKKNQTAAF
jgi:hypothetical protein